MASKSSSHLSDGVEDRAHTLGWAQGWAQGPEAAEAVPGHRELSGGAQSTPALELLDWGNSLTDSV